MVGPLRRWRADVRAQNQQARSVLHRLGGEERLLERIAVIGDLAEVLDVPAVGLEPLADLVGRGELGRTVDRDPVVVEHDVQPTEAEVAGERGGFVADALHEAAVAGNRPRVVVDEAGTEALAQHPLGDGHPHGVGEALAERSGGHLDARRVARLGMARGPRSERAERHEVVELEAVAAEVEHRVLEDRGVAVGEHEAVAVGPLRVSRVMAHDPAVQHVGERSEGHGRPLVAAVGVERGIHRQAADDLDRLGLEVGGQCRRHHARPYCPKCRTLIRRCIMGA